MSAGIKLRDTILYAASITIVWFAMDRLADFLFPGTFHPSSYDDVFFAAAAATWRWHS